jgi:putative hydrolase of the HAD superfamily
VCARIEAIGFDADDTHWHNKRIYFETQTRYRELLATYLDPELIDRRLYDTEMRNLQQFGYGIKAFALSMIETAVELTSGRVRGQDVMAIIDLARAMLTADVELLPGASLVVPALAERYPLLLITKGDLRDQESKLARSGLQQYSATSRSSMTSDLPIIRRC